MKIENLGKRQQRAIETKKKIYESARNLIKEFGIENVSVDSIVEAAGVSKGAFYVHFESKDALFATLVNEYTNIADMDYKSFLSSLPDDKSTFDILMGLAGEISDFIEHNIGIENMRNLYKAHLSKTVDTSSAISYKREIYKIFVEVLERGVEKGEIREDIQVDSLAIHLILAIRGIIFEACIRYPEMNLKEYVMEHFKILIYGLKK